MTSPLTETGKVNGDLGEGETEDAAEGLPIGVSYAPGIGSSPESRWNSASAVNPRVITTAS